MGAPKYHTTTLSTAVIPCPPTGMLRARTCPRVRTPMADRWTTTPPATRATSEMNALALLRHLRSEGFTIRAEGGRLSITPWSNLGDELRSRIRQAKDDLLALLGPEETSGRDPRPNPCPECGGRWVGIPDGYRQTHARTCNRFEDAPGTVLLARVDPNGHRLDGLALHASALPTVLGTLAAVVEGETT